MVWIPKISKRKIKEVGDVVLTSVMHENSIGTMTPDTLVKIIDKDDQYGYSIEDFAGHIIREIGWKI